MKAPLRITSTRHPRLLQIDARAWMARLAARDGRRVGLGDVRARDIDPIAELGFDLVWLTATWTIGSGSRRLARSSPELRARRAELLPDGSDDDIVGSPYAISAYEPADNLGGATGLAKLRQRLGEAGLGLILDFVPNHTAAEHIWVRRHPDWYVHANSGHRAADPDAYFEVRSDGRHWIAHGRDPNFPPWTDTAQLDYRHPDVPRAMTQALKEVATRCDGVVCSMAMLVLDDVFRTTWAGRSIAPTIDEEASPFGEFWWHATRSVHEVYPDFLLIGEAYWGLEWRLQQLGFDYTYDVPLLDRMVAGDVPLGRRPPAGRRWLPAPLRPAARGSQRAAHRGAAGRPPGARRGRRRGDRAGMLLVRDGQLEGARADVPIQIRREPTRSRTPGLRELYCRVLRATDDEAFRLGHAIRLEPTPAWPGNDTHEGLVARLWVGQHRQLRLAVVNLGGEPAQGFVPLALPEFAGKTVHLDDQLDDVSYERPATTCSCVACTSTCRVRPPPLPGHPPDDAVRGRRRSGAR